MVVTVIVAGLAATAGGAVIWRRRKDEARRMRRVAWRTALEKRWAESQARSAGPKLRQD